MNPTKTHRTTALSLLLLNGITASWGASGLLQAPSGEHLGYDLAWLEATPFSDYFWPAVVLLVANGLLSLLVAVLTLKRIPGYATLIVLQGVVLLGWLAAEVMWGIVFVLLQGAYLVVALGLIGSGSMLRRLT